MTRGGGGVDQRSPYDLGPEVANRHKIQHTPKKIMQIITSMN